MYRDKCFSGQVLFWDLLINPSQMGAYSDEIDLKAKQGIKAMFLCFL